MIFFTNKKMPIFLKKLKLSAPRKPRLDFPRTEENVSEFRDNIRIELDGAKELHFVEGNWVCLQNSSKSDECVDLLKSQSKDLSALKTQNSLYQIKLDIMVDLLSEKMAELDSISKANKS